MQGDGQWSLNLRDGTPLDVLEHLSDYFTILRVFSAQVPVEEVPNINAPLLLQFAENDDWVNKGWPAYEAALKKHNKSYQAYTYPGTQHGFHNDTTPRYDAGAAKLAWER